jgi:hypothetical protein
MTKEQFESRHSELLDQFPIMFQTQFANMAWEEGHSSGYEEVLWHLNDYVSRFAELIRKFGALRYNRGVEDGKDGPFYPMPL